MRLLPELLNIVPRLLHVALARCVTDSKADDYQDDSKAKSVQHIPTSRAIFIIIIKFYLDIVCNTWKRNFFHDRDIERKSCWRYLIADIEKALARLGARCALIVLGIVAQEVQARENICIFWG